MVDSPQRVAYRSVRLAPELVEAGQGDAVLAEVEAKVGESMAGDVTVRFDLGAS